MAVLVDSNVILDMATKDPHMERVVCGRAGSRRRRASVLVIEPIVFAEVSVEELEDALPPELYPRDPLPYEAAFLAGRSFLAHRRRGGAA